MFKVIPAFLYIYDMATNSATQVYWTYETALGNKVKEEPKFPLILHIHVTDGLMKKGLQCLLLFQVIP